VLIVLDNAHDANQVRPLLPGTPSALVLVTSRNQLTPLVAAEGAYPVDLDLLSTMECRQLLARRLGAKRVAAEPEAAQAIVESCARLPLALTIAAARAQQNGFALADVAEELRDAGRRLDALDAGDQHGCIRAVFSWSHRTLSADAARLLRLLGLHPGADIGASAAASLAGRPLRQARLLLTELVRANLLTEQARGRYLLHDLLRAYAADLVHHNDDAPTRDAALTRLLDHYTHTAHTADRLLHPLRDPITPALARPATGATVYAPGDDRQAMHWLAVEHQELLAAQRSAAETGHERHACQLAWSLDTYLTRRGYRRDLAATWKIALCAANRLDDPAAIAYAHRALAIASIEIEQYDDAWHHAQQAHEQYQHLGDQIGQGYALRDLAYLCWRQGDPEAALRHARTGLALFEATGHKRAIANELNGVGWYHAELGNHAEALRCCERALALLEALGDDVGAAYTWDSLGYAHHHLGNHAEATDCYSRALALHRQLGDRHDEADTLHRLGDTHLAVGDRDAAIAVWQRALDILTELAHPDAAGVRMKLDSSR
jgi:tetratricopeptide (TPR) repeat protein